MKIEKNERANLLASARRIGGDRRSAVLEAAGRFLARCWAKESGTGEMPLDNFEFVGGDWEYLVAVKRDVLGEDEDDWTRADTSAVKEGWVQVAAAHNRGVPRRVAARIKEIAARG